MKSVEGNTATYEPITYASSPGTFGPCFVYWVRLTTTMMPEKYFLPRNKEMPEQRKYSTPEEEDTSFESWYRANINILFSVF